MILAVDLNGVIHDQLHPIPGRRMGGSIEGAKEALEQLQAQGHKIIIHTDMVNRSGGVKVVEDWLDYYHIPYNGIWTFEGKPRADLFIDDKGLRFTSWGQALDDILALDGTQPSPRSQ